MFNPGNYVVSMQDTVETGREKINFLLSGTSSPFGLWSGTPEILNFESVYRVDEQNSNYISYRTDLYSGNSPFNLIFNGSGNTINSSGLTFPTGGFNIIDGVDNYILNSQQNIVVGSGNSINENTFYPGYGDGFNFVHGISNAENDSEAFPTNSSIISSSNSNLNNFFDSTILSSNNSSFNGGFLFDVGQFGFISGEQNNVNVTNIFIAPTNQVIGNGRGNTITTDVANSGMTTIINGQNNTISVNRNTFTSFNSALFGSNLTAVVENNYSHFQNLYVDQGLYATKVFFSADTSSYTLDTNYSFHHVAPTSGCLIRIPNPDNVNVFQILSITIPTSSLIELFFSDSTSNYLSTSTNMAAKTGNLYGAFGNHNRFSINYNYSTAYFFIWCPFINKWVAFTSDTSSSALL